MTWHPTRRMDIRGMLDMLMTQMPCVQPRAVGGAEGKGNGAIQRDNDGRMPTWGAKDKARSKETLSAACFLFFSVFSFYSPSLSRAFSHTLCLSLTPLPHPPSPRTNKVHQPHFLCTSVLKAALLKIERVLNKRLDQFNGSRRLRACVRARRVTLLGRDGEAQKEDQERR